MPDIAKSYLTDRPNHNSRELGKLTIFDRSVKTPILEIVVTLPHLIMTYIIAIM
jgi:hypothetical protein